MFYMIPDEPFGGKGGPKDIQRTIVNEDQDPSGVRCEDAIHDFCGRLKHIKSLAVV
jgi:hypothetical protein